MDILNWLYMKTAGLVKTTANNPDTDLIALGANVGFNKRDDQYQTYAMPLKDAVQSGIVANTAYYTLDMTDTNVVEVATPKGVIEVFLDSTTANPEPAFNTVLPIIISNPDMDFSNPDNIYEQITPYYSPDIDDTFIPYVLPTGFVVAGAQLAVLNANPSPAGVGQFKGRFYIYYELYNF